MARSTECAVCGEPLTMPFKCNECGRVHCSEHQLPENHHCPALNTRESRESFRFRGPGAQQGKGTEGESRGRNWRGIALLLLAMATVYAVIVVLLFA